MSATVATTMSTTVATTSATVATTTSATVATTMSATVATTSPSSGLDEARSMLAPPDGSLLVESTALVVAGILDVFYGPGPLRGHSHFTISLTTIPPPMHTTDMINKHIKMQIDQLRTACPEPESKLRETDARLVGCGTFITLIATLS
eukprot:575823_1